jgi:hypothetical protein
MRFGGATNHDLFEFIAICGSMQLVGSSSVAAPKLWIGRR